MAQGYYEKLYKSIKSAKESTARANRTTADNLETQIKNKKTRLEAEVARSTKMLSNPGFVNKAPEAKVQEEKEKMQKYKEMLEDTIKRLEQI